MEVLNIIHRIQRNRFAIKVTLSIIIESVAILEGKRKLHQDYTSNKPYQLSKTKQEK